MSTKPSSWYAFSAEGAATLRCAACHSVIDLEAPVLDHHPRVCPRCGVNCAFLNWKGRILQLVSSDAPPVIERALRFAQQDFDELEYARFVVALEQLMDDLYAANLPPRCT
jgi:hypothetical protein